MLLSVDALRKLCAQDIAHVERLCNVLLQSFQTIDPAQLNAARLTTAIDSLDDLLQRWENLPDDLQLAYGRAFAALAQVRQAVALLSGGS